MTSVQPIQPVITKATPPVEGSTSIQLATCTTSGFRPETRFTMVWTFDGQQKSYTETPVWDTTSETYSVSSQYMSVVDRTDNGKSLMCSVNHGTIGTPKTETVTSSVLCKLERCPDIHLYIFLYKFGTKNIGKPKINTDSIKLSHMFYLVGTICVQANVMYLYNVHTLIDIRILLFPNSQSKHSLHHSYRCICGNRNLSTDIDLYYRLLLSTVQYHVVQWNQSDHK